MLRNMPCLPGFTSSASRDRSCAFSAPAQQKPSHTLGKLVATCTAAARSSLATLPSFATLHPTQLRRCITTHACTAAAAASGLVRRHTPDFLMPSNMHSCLLLGVAAVPSSFLFSPSPAPARSAAPSLPVRSLPRSSAAPSLPSRTLPVCAALRPQLSTKSQTPSPLLRTSVPHPHEHHHHHHSMQGAPHQLQPQQQRSLLVAAPCVAAAAVETAVAVASSNATAELVAVIIGHLVCIGSLFRSLPQVRLGREQGARG